MLAMGQQQGPVQVQSSDNVYETSSGKDLVTEVRERLNEAFLADRHNREDAVTDLRFLAGDQWPEYARQARANRPMLTINKLPQFLFQVTNAIRQSAPVLKVTPVDGNLDPQMAQIYDGIISDIQYRSSAKHVYATGAYHAAACGIGHWRVKNRYISDDSFDQELGLELIPFPLSVYWDPAAVLPDRSDAMWCIVVEMIPKATFKLRYPDAIVSSVDDMRPSSSMQTGLFWQSSDFVLVAEYWLKKPTKRTIAAFQSGATFDVTQLPFQVLAQIQQQNGQMVQKRDVPSYRVEQSLVTGADVLNGPNQWPGKYIPIVATIGNEVPLESIIMRHGLIRHARDAQSLYNYNRSAAAESIALMPKAPYLLTDKMIAPYRSEWNTAGSQNRPFLRYVPDGAAPGARPERIQPPSLPEAFWRESQIATDDIKATTGIYDASLGARSNETSGVAIKRREEQGDTANYHYQDNLIRSIEHTGRILIDLIPKIYDNQRVVRLMSEDGKQQFAPINMAAYSHNGEPVLVNDLSVGRYDIRVTIGPSYQTKRLESAQALTELMHAVAPEQAAALAPHAVRNMDIPDAEKIAKVLEAGLPPHIANPDMPPPDPMQDPANQAKVAKDFATAHNTMADANQKAFEMAAMFGAVQPPMPPPLPPEAMPQPPPGMMPPGAMPPDGMPMQPDGAPPMPNGPMPGPGPMPDDLFGGPQGPLPA